MAKIGRLPFIVIVIMTVVSFTNIFGLKLAGLAVIIGVMFFFITQVVEKQPFEGSGLDLGAIGRNLKDKQIWIWLCLPIVMDGVSMGIATLFLPEYINHVLDRADAFVSYEQVLLLLFQLAFLALGEEIAWRAFFQKQLNKVLSIVPVLLLSSVLFALGHITEGEPVIVIYDIFFVFVNSVLYGIIFLKSNNAWVSGLSHFVANLLSVLVLLLL